MAEPEIYTRVTAYEVTVWPEDAYDDPATAMDASTWHVTVECVPGFEGIRWAVRAGSRCLGADGEWDREPIPSSRTPEWRPR